MGRQEEYEAEMERARNAGKPTWKRMPNGHQNVEKETLSDKLKAKLGADEHKMKKNGKW